MNWFILAIVFAAAFAVCLILTPVVRAAALAFGLVDEPDGRRKMHTRPIPVAGGVAVLLATSAVLAVVLALAGPVQATLGDRWLTFTGLAAAAFVIALVGVIDDFRGLRGRYKVAGQLVAIAIVMACDVKIPNISLFGVPIELVWWAYPLTAFWLFGAINSLNLIDGMDGLLGSVGCIICASIAVMAFLNSQFETAVIAIALAGSLVGFLCFNFPPASIFLGDCGSMLIGLVVGVLAIESSLKGPATVALAVPAALLVIPIFDSSAAILRRWLTGRSIFTTDRGHLHHCLQGRGLSNRTVLLLVGGLSLLASIGALASVWLKTELYAALSIFVVLGVFMMTRLFGHAEFLLLKERLMGVLFAVRHGHQGGRVHQLEVRLQGSADWNDLWKNVTACAEEMRLKAVCLDVNAPAIMEDYHARWGKVVENTENPAIWRLQFPLQAHGQVVGRLEIAGQRHGMPVDEKLASIAKLVADVELAVAGLTRSRQAPRLDPVPAADTLRLEGAHSS
jgi:UDP-GlcNAc:undecaprenyl-phosphate GlcNAc-1-phosphate transferase